MAGAAVSWSSKKQPLVALSSTKGEYMAIAHVTKEVIWIQQFPCDVQFPLSHPSTILANNQGAIALATNPTFHAWTKHIGVQHHFIWDQVKKARCSSWVCPYRWPGCRCPNKGITVWQTFEVFCCDEIMGLGSHWVGMFKVNFLENWHDGFNHDIVTSSVWSVGCWRTFISFLGFGVSEDPLSSSHRGRCIYICENFSSPLSSVLCTANWGMVSLLHCIYLLLISSALAFTLGNYKWYFSSTYSELSFLH